MFRYIIIIIYEVPTDKSLKSAEQTNAVTANAVGLQLYLSSSELSELWTVSLLISVIALSTTKKVHR